MAKLTLGDVTNFQNEGSAASIINDNSVAIEEAMEKTLSRDGTTPNQMTSSLDMNGNKIMNLPDASTPQEPLTLSQYVATSGGIAGAVRFDTVQSLTSPQQAQARTNIGASAGGAAVSSVFGRTGAVVATTNDYAVAQVTGAAPTASPAFTGVPTAPTASFGTNTTQLATCAFAIANAGVGAVSSVFGRTGAVTAVSGDYTAGQITNTPAGGIAAITVQTAINELDTEKANLASPTFTGTPASTTPSAADSTTKIATTAFVQGELTTGLALKAPIASPTFTGVPAAPTAAPGTNTTQLATTAFVTAAGAAGVTDHSVTAVKLTASALGYGLVNGTLAASVGSSALTIAVKTLAGTDPSASDPVYFVFRNATAATGNFVVRTVTAALSIVVPSGSSLGTVNGIPFRIWVTAIDDGGTVRLGVLNARASGGLVALPEYSLSQEVRPLASPGNTSGAGIVYSTHSTATVTTPIASPGQVNWTSHGLLVNTPVIFTVSGGSLPTGITAVQVYYVKTVTNANSFTIAATPGGTAINFTGTTTGTQTGWAGVLAAPQRILGFATYEAGLATAGTWSAVPTSIQLFGPGVPKIGDIIQSQVVTGGTQQQVGSVTGTYFTIPNLTNIMTLTSAANLVSYDWNTSAQITAAADSGILSLQRGGTAIGQVAAIFHAGAGMITQVGNSNLDFPAGVGPHSYTIGVQLIASGGGLVEAPSNTATSAIIQCAEVMS